jgi:hypothetical protein
VFIETRENNNLKDWLLDINPWIPVAVDSLLFSWEELQNN